MRGKYENSIFNILHNEWSEIQQLQIAHERSVRETRKHLEMTVPSELRAGIEKAIDELEDKYATILQEAIDTFESHLKDPSVLRGVSLSHNLGIIDRVQFPSENHIYSDPDELPF